MTTTTKEKLVHPPSPNRLAKGDRVKELGGDLKDVHTVVVVHQLGLNADETLDLRRKLRAAGVGLKVGKNTLIKHAIKGTKIEGIEKFLHGPTALAYSKDPIAAAKITVEFAKKNEKLKIIAAAMGDQLLDAAQTKALATLPSLNELRARIVIDRLARGSCYQNRLHIAGSELASSRT